jgi:O-antigen/teichoic acid export membrane protein
MAGLLGNLAVGLVSFPIFTRVLSVSEYGVMDLGQRLLLLLTVASKAGIQNAALRLYSKSECANNTRSARTYYSTLFFGMLATSGVVLCLCLLVAVLFPGTITVGALGSLVYLLASLALLRAMGSILWGFLRIEERTKSFNIISVASKVATIAVVCSLLPWIGHSARTYFVGTAWVEALFVVGLSAWLQWRGVLSVKCFKFDMFREAVAFGAPLIVYEFAFAILGSTDRFLVRHYLGSDALGFYAVAHGLARNVNELLVAPLSLALIPIYMRIWASQGAEKTSAFLTVALDLFIVAAAGALAVLAASGHAVVVVLASSKYLGAERLIPVILAALLVYAMHVFVAAGLLIHKRTLLMAGVLVVSSIANIGLNCLLLPRMGLMGGAVATLLSYLGCILSLAYASNRYLPLGIHGRSLAKYAIAATVAWAVGTKFSMASPALELLAKSTLVVAVYAIVLYVLDHRVRSAVRWAIRWLQGHRQQTTGVEPA